MTKERSFIIIDDFKGHLKITNNTDYDLYLGTRPIPPKRKVIVDACIPANQFILCEQDGSIDWLNIYIEFRQPKGKSDVESGRK